MYIALTDYLLVLVFFFVVSLSVLLLRMETFIENPYYYKYPLSTIVV